MKKLILLPIIPACIFASGFRIPEQSGDSVALAASNVATSFGADAMYYNPANIVFLDPRHHMTLSSAYLRTSVVHFQNDSTTHGSLNYDTKSRDGNFFIPGFHMVFPFISDRARAGVSVATPAGVTMRWDDSYPRSIAEIFQLKVVELNPSIAYMIRDDLSVGFGVRSIYARGKARNNVEKLRISVDQGRGYLSAGREIEGDSVDFGYNLALAYKPTENLSLAATYKSKINMTLEGNAKIQSSVEIENEKKLMQIPKFANLIKLYKSKYQGSYDGHVDIDVPLPAVLTLGASYKYNDLTFLFAYDRTFWSDLKEFDFNYSREIPVSNLFDKPVEKDWHDTDTYRFGLAYDYSNRLRLMGGFAIDETAANSDKIRFELPDAKAYVYSLGANYKFTDSLEVTSAFLYQDRQKRRVEAKDDKVPFNNLVGYFGNSRITILNLSLNYTF